MLAESNVRKLPKYNRRITLDLRNVLAGTGFAHQMSHEVPWVTLENDGLCVWQRKTVYALYELSKETYCEIQNSIKNGRFT